MNDLKVLHKQIDSTVASEKEATAIAKNIPVASANTLGGIKVGSNLSITKEGVLSAQCGVLPLVIIGTVSDGAFTPNAGQSDFGIAQQYFTDGKPVYLAYGNSAELVIENKTDDALHLSTKNVTWTEEDV